MVKGNVPWSANIAVIKLAFVNGILNVIAMFSYYCAIKLGRLSLVSPIGASWGIVPVMISILFLGEKLGFLDSILISLIVLGVILISLHTRTDEQGKQNSALFLALIAAFSGSHRRNPSERENQNTPRHGSCDGVTRCNSDCDYLMMVDARRELPSEPWIRQFAFHTSEDSHAGSCCSQTNFAS